MDAGATRIRASLVVAVVATLLGLPPVGRRLIATGGINDDEARYPLMARDMRVRGVGSRVPGTAPAPVRRVGGPS